MPICFELSTVCWSSCYVVNHTYLHAESPWTMEHVWFLTFRKYSMLVLLFSVAEMYKRGISNELSLCLFVVIFLKFSNIKMLSEPVSEKLVCLWKFLCVQSVVEGLHCGPKTWVMTFMEFSVWSLNWVCVAICTMQTKMTLSSMALCHEVPVVKWPWWHL